MFAQQISLGIHNGSRRHDIGSMQAQEVAVIAIAQEAEILTVLLAGDIQPQFFGERADFVFMVLADRKQRARQLRLPHDAEDVALIFLSVQAATQAPAVGRILTNPRIVTRGQVVRIQRQGIVEQPVEANMAVAFQAGVGRIAILDADR